MLFTKTLSSLSCNLMIIPYYYIYPKTALPIFSGEIWLTLTSEESSIRSTSFPQYADINVLIIQTCRWCRGKTPRHHINLDSIPLTRTFISQRKFSLFVSPELLSTPGSFVFNWFLLLLSKKPSICMDNSVCEVRQANVTPISQAVPVQNTIWAW